MKSLLINVGFGWSATTPLFKTLVKNKYFTGWQNKESNLLGGSIQNYVYYYQSLIDKRVVDFSNSNADLSSEYIDMVAPVLKEHFDVKVTMIVRDPVRRFYSMCVHNYRKNVLGIHQNEYTGDRTSDEVLPYFRSMLPQARHSYVETYKTYSKHFPMHVIVMEKLWSDEEELSKLSEFLDYPLQKLYPNVYHDGVLHPKLKDQWTDDIPLPKLDYLLARKQMSWMYEEWEKEFDEMPWTSY